MVSLKQAPTWYSGFDGGPALWPSNKNLSADRWASMPAFCGCRCPLPQGPMPLSSQESMLYITRFSFQAGSKHTSRAYTEVTRVTRQSGSPESVYLLTHTVQCRICSVVLNTLCCIQREGARYPAAVPWMVHLLAPLRVSHLPELGPVAA